MKEARAEGGKHGTRTLRIPGWVVGIGFFVAAAMAAWWRQPKVARGTMWAEEGSPFLQEALDHGAWGVIFLPYQGYLQVVPRLLTAIALGNVPIEKISTTLTALCCMVAALAGVVVLACSRAVLPTTSLRLIAASITVLAPAMTHEVLGNTPNLHWYFIWMTPWILLSVPRTYKSSTVLSVIVLLATLSEIQLAVFVPLCAWRWRERKRWPIYAALIVGAISEFVVTLVWPRHYPVIPATPQNLVFGYFLNVTVPLVAPTAATWHLVVSSIGIVRTGAFLLLMTLVIGIFALWKGSAVQRLATVTLTLGAHSSMSSRASRTSPPTMRRCPSQVLSDTSKAHSATASCRKCFSSQCLSWLVKCSSVNEARTADDSAACS